MKRLRRWTAGRGATLGLALLIVVGAALRLAPIGANRFHQDEALYSFWGLQIASGRDPILSQARVDKPPLFIYTLALCFKLLGPSEVAARLPSELASVASIALLYYLAWRLYGRSVALVAAILMALSPFNILFAPTAFTDPLMVAWVLAALCLAAQGSFGWTGIALGLASATKQQGLLFVPLVVAIAAHWLMSYPLSLGSSVPPHLRTLLRGGFHLALGFLAVMAPVAWWDSLRWRLQPSYIEQSLTSYGGLALVDPAQLVERLADWAEILHYVTASPFLNTLLLLGLPCLILYDLVWRRGEPATFFAKHSDVVLSAFVALFLLGHWLLSFNVWDRYLLGLVPLLLILLARILWLVSGALVDLLHPFQELIRRFADSLIRSFLVALLLAVTLAGPAWAAAQSGYPIGGDHGAYDGIEAVADYFRDEAPAGSILYHHWLGWHYSFYLFDSPLVLRWHPSPEELAEEARQLDDAQRYIVFPREKSTAGAREALAEAGLGLRSVYSAYGRDGSISFTVYRIEDRK